MMMVDADIGTQSNSGNDDKRTGKEDNRGLKSAAPDASSRVPLTKHLLLLFHEILLMLDTASTFAPKKKSLSSPTHNSMKK